ncbi:MAG: hypothetical protein ACW96X_00020 [Promethearchaeota archaeon]
MFIVIVYSVNLSLYLLSPKALSNDGLNERAENVNLPNTIKSANGDTTAPVITFVRPDNNETSIRTRYYDFIVNITDANPPVLGNVTIEIANASTSFFNASMLYDPEDLWFFPWDNLTSYPNEQSYTIRVRAIDSSSNENHGLSDDLFVMLNVFDARVPNILQAVLYIVAVIVIFAIIIIYINKKRNILKVINKKG